MMTQTHYSNQSQTHDTGMMSRKSIPRDSTSKKSFSISQGTMSNIKQEREVSHEALNK